MDSFRTLNSGVTMPTIGFGTYLIEEGQAAYNAVSTALRAGYRHIDTAAAYGNELSVGRAVRDSGIPRQDIFITTKLWNADVRKGNTEAAFAKSLELLGGEYIDLYLIHWPAEGFADAWPVMEALNRRGVAKAIGVSNFQPHHIDAILKRAEVVPAVNQIECHPYLTQQELRDYCAKHRILCESWSPLGGKGGRMLEDQTIKTVADKHHKTLAQIILRWNVQLGLSVNPKSEHPERIRENLDVFNFTLSEDDMRVISGLDKGKRFGPDPDNFDF